MRPSWLFLPHSAPQTQLCAPRLPPIGSEAKAKRGAGCSANPLAGLPGNRPHGHLDRTGPAWAGGGQKVEQDQRVTVCVHGWESNAGPTPHRKLSPGRSARLLGRASKKWRVFRGARGDANPPAAVPCVRGGRDLGAWL